MITHKDLGAVKLIEIQGQFSVEEAFALRKKCWDSYKGEKLVFNLERASFIGSSGLIPLLKDLSNLGESSGQVVHLVGIKPEVKRLINGLGMKGFRTFVDVHQAITELAGPCAQD
jgi:anti-anti-sigma factor